MRIRLLEEGDLDALLALYSHLFDRDDPLPERPRLQEVWSSMVGNPMIETLGLELDDRLVSTCTLTITPNLTRGTRPYALIENVVTHVHYRRRGLGHQLIRHAMQLAWQQDCYKVMLMTGKEGAHHFYEQCGFRKGVKTGFVAYPS